MANYQLESDYDQFNTLTEKEQREHLEGLNKDAEKNRRKGKKECNITFHLKTYEGKNQKERPIMCYLNLNLWEQGYKQLTFSTGLRVHPDLWDKKRYICIGQNEFLNHQLSILKQVIERKYKQFLDLEHKENYFVDEIKKEWQTILPTLTNNNKHLMSIPITFNQRSLTEGIDITQTTFAEYIKRVIPLKEKGNKSDYNLLLKEVKAFPPCLLSELSHLYFFDLFNHWKQTKNWTVGTFGGYKKNAKVFYHYAIDTDKLTLPKITFKEKDLLKAKKSDDSKDVSLSFRQVKRIYELENLPAHLEQTMHAMIIGIFSGGVRKSDLIRLKNMEEGLTIDGQKFHSIKTVSKKTKNFVHITLHKIASELLIKYGGQIPAIVKDRKFDTYMQDVCREAKLTHTIRTQKEDLSTGKITEDFVPFCDLVTSGTIRKTFCTMMRKEPFNIDVDTIMGFSGHKSIQAYELYIASSGDVDETNAYTQMILKDKTFDKVTTNESKLVVSK